MATPNIVPRADSEGGLGTASKYWASAYIDLIDAGNINCSTSSTFVIQHTTANQDIRFKGIDGSSSITALLLDMSAAGAATFSGNLTLTTGDFFLASGAVINFGAGDVTLTHSSNTLVLDGGDFKFRTSKKAVFGDAGSIEIYSDNTHGYIKNTTTDGDLVLMSDDGSSGETAYITLDGSAVETQFNKDVRVIDNEKLIIGTGNDLEVFSLGQDILFRFWSGNATFTNYSDDADIIFQSDDGSGGTAEYFRVDGSSEINIFSKDVRLNDSIELQIGAHQDLKIYHDGTINVIEASAGDLYLVQHNNDKDILFQSDNGAGSIATYFYLDGSSAAHNGSATTALYTNWPDNSRISLGTSHDLTIHHSGTSSAFANAVGHLEFIQSATDADIKFYCDDGSGGITEYFRLDGSDVKIISSQAFHLLDNKSLIAGTGSDFTINHDGTNSYLSNNTGDLYIRNLADDKDIIFQSDDGSGGVETYFFLDGSASSGNPFTVFPDLSELAFGTSRDLRIKHDGTDSKITNSTGDLYIINNADDGDIIFQSDDGSGGIADYLRFDGTAGNIKAYKDIRFQDNEEAEFGTSGDLSIYHDGTNSALLNETGDLFIQQNADNKDIRFQCDNGSGGLTDYIKLDGGDTTIKIDQNTRVLDSKYLALGSGSDLQLSHDGSNSKIVANGTGALIITQGAADQDIILKCDDGSGGETAYLTLDGSVAKTTVHRPLKFDDSISAEYGTGTDMIMYHSGGAGYIENYTGNFQIIQQVDDGDIIFKSDDGSGGVTPYLTLDGGATAIVADKSIYMADSKRFYAGGGGDLGIYHDGTNSYINNTTGKLFINNQTNDSDIVFRCDDGSGGVTEYLTLDGGTEQVEITKNMRFTDNVKALFGIGSDLKIYHDGSNSYIDDAGTGSLYIRGANDVNIGKYTGEQMIKAIADNGVEIYHNNVKKFETTSTGVAVTGGLTTTSTVILSNLPTSDPGTTGQLWNDNGTLKISAGG